jgi:uncharacterized membrane protein
LRTSFAWPVRLTVALALASVVMATIIPSVSADNGLQVTTPYPAVTVAPGSKVSFDLTVSSTRDADVALNLTGVPTGWTASLIGGGNVVNGVSVTSAKDGTVRLDVTVPADAAAATNTIRVTGIGGGATDVLPVKITVNAGAAGNVSLTTTTPTLTGSSDTSFSFSLTFNNDTAQDLTVSATAEGDPSWTIDAKLSGEANAASTVVKAGSTVGIDVTAKAPADTAAGNYPIKVTATGGDKTATADLAIEVTGSYSMTLGTPNDVLSANGSAGQPTKIAFVVTNTGTAPITAVKLTGTPPTDWKVDYDPADGVPTIAPGDTGTINATVTPSGQAVAGDYVVSFAAKGTESGASGTAQIRFTVETSPLWAFIGIGIIVLIIVGLFYVFRTYGRR